MTYTSHGHHISGTIKGDNRPERVARCGGPGLCPTCSREAALAPKDIPASSQHFEEQAESFPATIYEEESDLEKELGHLLNKHSAENESGTPDFILAMYLKAQLDLFNMTVKQRAVWRGEHVELPALYNLENGIKRVPLVAYTNGQPNEIGEARIKVTPGEALIEDPIVGVAAIFEYLPTTPKPFEESDDLNEPKDEPLDALSGSKAMKEVGSEIPQGVSDGISAFDRYQKKGLTDNGK